MDGEKCSLSSEPFARRKGFRFCFETETETSLFFFFFHFGCNSHSSGRVRGGSGAAERGMGKPDFASLAVEYLQGRIQQAKQEIGKLEKKIYDAEAEYFSSESSQMGTLLKVCATSSWGLRRGFGTS